MNSGLEGTDLSTGGRYVVAIAYADTSRLAYHAYNLKQNIRSYSSLIFTTFFGYGSKPVYFQDNFNAVLRLNLALVSTTDQQPLPNLALTVTPNPAKDYIHLNIHLDHDMPLTVTIADLTGKVILTDERESVHQEQLDYRLPNLVPGTYLARIATAKGTSTRKFVVAKQ